MITWLAYGGGAITIGGILLVLYLVLREDDDG